MPSVGHRGQSCGAMPQPPLALSPSTILRKHQAPCSRQVTSYRQIFRSTGLLGSVQALYIAIAVVRGKVAALLIGASGMGMADIYNRIVDLVGSATNFGLSLSAVKQLAPLCDQVAQASQQRGAASPQRGSASQSCDALLGEARSEVAHVRTWVMLTALLGTVVCLALSPLLSLWFTTSYDHALSIAILAPAIGFATITGGEMAVLKASHRLKHLARATASGALCTLLLSVVIYALWGMAGIAPLITLAAAALFGLCLKESRSLFAYRLCAINSDFLRSGRPLFRLGSAFIVAGVMASGSEALIRSILMRMGGGLTTVGLYAAGFTLIVNYGRLLFTAVEADYFPRLTAALGNKRAVSLTIDRQINTLAVLMSPLLILFAIALPLIVRILYTSEFLAIIPLVVCASPYMYFKAIYTPIAYLPLSHGHSVLYMCMELSYNVAFCLLVVLGYRHGGLMGAGLGVSAANLFDLLAISTIYHYRYGYTMHRGTLRRVGLLALPLALGLWASTLSSLTLRLSLGLLALICTLPAAWPVVKRARK